MALQEWELQQQLFTLLPLGEGELTQILSYVGTLSTPEANGYLNDLLGDSPKALRFITAFNESRAGMDSGGDNGTADGKGNQFTAPSNPLSSKSHPATKADVSSSDMKTTTMSDSKSIEQNVSSQVNQPPTYAPPPMPPPTSNRAAARHHKNPVIEAGRIRARDEVRLYHSDDVIQAS